MKNSAATVWWLFDGDDGGGSEAGARFKMVGWRLCAGLRGEGEGMARHGSSGGASRGVEESTWFAWWLPTRRRGVVCGCLVVSGGTDGGEKGLGCCDGKNHKAEMDFFCFFFLRGKKHGGDPGKALVSCIRE